MPKPKTKRTEKLEAAFADTGDQTKVGSLKLRPFSLGTLNVCRQLGLSLFLDDAAEIDDAEKQRQIVAFAWAQAAPLPEVLKALRSGTAEAKIAEFAFAMDVGDLPELIKEIGRISELAAAAAVEVAPKPADGSDDEGAPPNS